MTTSNGGESNSKNNIIDKSNSNSLSATAIGDIKCNMNWNQSEQQQEQQQSGDIDLQQQEWQHQFATARAATLICNSNSNSNSKTIAIAGEQIHHPIDNSKRNNSERNIDELAMATIQIQSFSVQFSDNAVKNIPTAGSSMGLMSLPPVNTESTIPPPALRPVSIAFRIAKATPLVDKSPPAPLLQKLPLAVSNSLDLIVIFIAQQAAQSDAKTAAEPGQIISIDLLNKCM
eukprot:jgi/Psemu1/19567/gm1.19567_g